MQYNFLQLQYKFSRAHWLIFIVKKTDRCYNLSAAPTSESGQFDSLLS